MLSGLSEPQVRILGFILGPVIVVVSTLTAYYFGGYPLAVLTSIVSIVTLAVLVRALTPPWFGRSKSQIYSLLILSTTAIAILAPAAILEPIIEHVYTAAGLSPPKALEFWQRCIVLIIVAISIIALNFVWASQQITAPSEVAPAEATSPFHAEGYRQLRDEFCRYMIGVLDQYDRDVNWCDSDYTTLTAEVEMERRGGQQPRVVRDLVKAIQTDRDSRAFTLLGEPGSGKSVSLRRLTRSLYVQTRQTGIVPVYVNLREWDGPPEPSDEDVPKFIMRQLRLQSGRSGMRFLDTWFDLMLERGLFFFILDSFDEMPAILDSDDASTRLNRISQSFDRFFNDLHRCRGIISSRIYRQPRGFRSRRLTIRPFQEEQVIQAMRRWFIGSGIDARHAVLQLIRTRPELGNAIRNPFSADLVSQYILKNSGQLPDSYFAVFEDYVNRRLAEDSVALQELRVSSDSVVAMATRIAWTMYSSGTGLEVERTSLATLVPEPDLDRHIDALKMSRLARVGGARGQMFSFAHRRVAEFFVVRSIIINHGVVPLSSIPEDSRWRDCLAIYCAVGPADDCERIANHAWSVIQASRDQLLTGDVFNSRPAVHCLRFLVEAFRGRLECIASFHSELSTLLMLLLLKRDILVRKIAAESLCLACESEREMGLIIALKLGPSWIADSAIRSCRHMGHVGDYVSSAVRQFLYTLSASEVIRKYGALSFTFSLSSSFRSVLWALRVDVLSLMFLWILWGYAAMIEVATFDYTINAAGTKSFHDAVFYLFPSVLLFFGPVVIEFYVARKRVTQENPRFRGFVWRSGFDTSVRMSLVWYLITRADTIGFTRSFGLVALLMLRDMWERLPKRVPEPKQIWNSAKSGLILILGLAIILTALLGVGFLLTRVFGGSFAFYLPFLASLIMLYSFLGPAKAAAIEAMERFKDRRLLSQLAPPDMVSREWVFAVSERLHSSAGRRHFLELLLTRSVQVFGAQQKPPTILLLDEKVGELFARLEERWIGLEQ